MDGYLRLGLVNQHKDLLIGDDQCIGGGYYQFDWTSNRLLLDRASYDFAADEAGNLPPDLKRGVLSEDGIWNLLSDYREIQKIKQ